MRHLQAGLKGIAMMLCIVAAGIAIVGLCLLEESFLTARFGHRAAVALTVLTLVLLVGFGMGVELFGRKL